MDAGALGIICPMINNKAEAEHFVKSCMYPPHGIRSFSPIVAFGRRDKGYRERANQDLLKFAMIETKEALDNLEDICSVSGLTGLFIGPSDLAISIGRPPSGNPTDEIVLREMKKIIDIGHKHGLKVGCWAGGDGTFAAKMVKEYGADWVVSSCDQEILIGGMDKNLHTMQTLLGKNKSD